MKKLTDLDYKKALEFATKKHDGQFRKGGNPYITHPIAVSEIVKSKGYGIDYQIAALFHDLLEDTDATREQIKNLSNDEVLHCVELLTKQKGYIMKEYVDNIKSNKMAFAVKCADRLHNLRCATQTDETFKRKYILETIDWYWDFSDEIRAAAKDLAKTLSAPMTDYPFLYESDHTWKI